MKRRRRWWFAAVVVLMLANAGTARAFLEGIAPEPVATGVGEAIVTCDGFLACSADRSTVTVSLANNGDDVTGSVCDWKSSWCAMGASPWSSVFTFDCSYFDGTTWYGNKLLNGNSGSYWRLLVKVVDRGIRGDELAVEFSTAAPTEDGRCGAGALASRPLHVGDFTVY